MTAPAQILFVSPTIKPGDTVHVNSSGCRAGAPWREYTQPIIVIAGTEHSDYSGGPTNRSNERVLLGMSECEPYLIQLIGSHGYSGLAYQGYLGPVPFTEELADSVELIDDGECLDEGDESALEQELVSEAWEDFGRKEFRTELQSVLDAMDDDAPHDLVECGDVQHEELDEIWRAGCDALNVNGGSGHMFETGCVVHFYTSEWVKRIQDHRWISNPKHRRATQIAELVHRLRNLCMRTRITAA